MSRDFWLLAHPDDEIFGIPLWFKKENDTLFHFMVTKPSIRMHESRKLERYLTDKGFHINVSFSTHEYVDGKVSQCITRNALLDLISLIRTNRPDRLIALTFEGGHQDHDYLSELTRLIASALHIQFVQVPAYQSTKSGFGFRVMKVPQFPYVTSFISPRILVVALRVALIYRSQWKTWLGLLPGILCRYSRFRYRYLVDEDRLAHNFSNKYLYEKRRRADSQREKMEIETLITTFRDLLVDES
jgi:hypothetical protein